MKRNYGQTVSVHSGSATRAPVDVEKPTGEDRPNADDGARDRPDPRAENEFGDGRRCGAIFAAGTGHYSILSRMRISTWCGEWFALSGPTKGPLREFVQEIIW